MSAVSGGSDTAASPVVAGKGSDSESGRTPPVSPAAATSGSAEGAALSFYAGLPAAPAAPAAGQGGQAVPAPLAASAPPALTSRVHARFDLAAVTSGPFPSDRWTVLDLSQNTFLRVNLPQPDRLTHPSDWEDVQVLNTLDGFNLQPRLSIPFDGAIDPYSVSSRNVFLMSLGSTTGEGGDPFGKVVGINQVVWDVATTTLHAESDELLSQHTRYLLVATSGLRDAGGAPAQASRAFRAFLHDPPRSGEPLEILLQRAWLRVGLLSAEALGVVSQSEVVTASVFTTQSATAVLEKIRDQIHAATPAPPDFLLGPGGTRTVFDLDEMMGITSNQQTRVDPPAFAPATIDVAALRVIPGAVRQIAFGKYFSPDYEVHPGEYIPPVATRTGTPTVQGTNEVYFNLFLPSGSEPAGGWPVAIFGHGNGNNKDLSFLFAASMADRGIATIAINVVGHGFGPLSTLTVNQTGGEPVMLLAGGRGRDQDGDNTIGSTEGLSATGPRTIIQNRDGIRQTVADLMQLVRVIEVGVDVNGDGSRDLDPARVYYFGRSLGGIYGTDFLAVEPDVQAGALLVPGGAWEEVSRLAAGTFRPGTGNSLGARTPPLLNSPGITSIDGITAAAPNFNENLPLRDGVPLSVRLADGTTQVIQSPVVNTVVGAMAIQELFENTEWVSQSGNPVAYAPHLRKAPLPGVPAKPVLVQFAKGDQTVPNPTATALLRAGDLADRATFYRHDLAFAEEPRLPTNPHGFPNPVTSLIPLQAAIARGAQAQIATFFASDGKEVLHPEPARFFEVPIQGPLPEDLNFIL
jgi:dienelactone hydrolase